MAFPLPVSKRARVGPACNFATSSDIGAAEDMQSISLTEQERSFFEILRHVVASNEAEGTVVRVAGGWVRDKLLGRQTKDDIDIAVDKMSGKSFAEAVNRWLKKQGAKTFSIGVIEQNPEKSKHLETAAVQIGSFSVDFSNLRTENYTEESRIPVISLGTPYEDAMRRDLTINSLYYNVNTGRVEDFTGRGFMDLRSGLIATPLDALVTLLDDPLRSLRAVRFACRFQFRIADDLMRACMEPRVRSALQLKVSKERIGAELENMLEAPHGTRAIAILNKMNIFPVIIQPPESLDRAIVDSIWHSSNVEKQFIWGVASSLVVSDLCRLISSEGTFSNIQVSGENIRLVRLAALLSFCDGVQCKNPAKANGRLISLMEYILNQNLKVRGKDVESILKMREACKGFESLIELILSSRSSEISRLQLGLAVRAMGAKYEYAAVLAASALIMRRTIESLNSSSNVVHDVISAIAPEESSGRDLLPPVEHTNKTLTVLLEHTSVVNSALRGILDLIQKHKVETSWELKPLINGKEIMKVIDIDVFNI